jgi:hypothetical protein
MTMQHPESHPHSQRGATRQTRRSPSTRAVLKALMDAVSDPHSLENRNSIWKRFLAFVRSKDGQQHIDVIAEYWFTNQYRQMLVDYPEPIEQITKRQETERAVQAAAEQTRERLQKSVDEAIERRARTVLLDWILPNGKALRDCSGRECKEMSGRVGKWLGQIARRVKPREIVGDVLQEADVRKLFGSM